MLSRLQKWLVVPILMVVLTVFQVFPAYADTMDPQDYIFIIVLRSCGIPVVSQVGQWEAAYKGYLESTGNRTLLNKLESYSDLSWGSSADGIDDLYRSVREWISKCSISDQPISNGTYIFSAPSKSDSFPSELGATGIQDTPFTDVCTTPDISGYTYLFSDSYVITVSSGRQLCVRRNIYGPTGAEIIGIGNFTSYNDSTTVKFYTVDSSSSTGYRECTLRSMATSYYLDTGAVNGKDSKFTATLTSKSTPFRSAMNFPFKVFSNTADAENYCKTGTISGIFSKNTSSLWSYGDSWGFSPDKAKSEVSFVGSTLKLPSDFSVASRQVLMAISSDMLTFVNYLNASGMEISYVVEYTVEHLTWATNSYGNFIYWLVSDRESLSGIVGDSPVINVKDYPNLLYDSGPSSDAKISNEAVFKVYYKGDPEAIFPYTIEYYKDGELFETLSNNVLRFGNGGTSHRLVESCEDLCPKYYLLDEESSTSFPFTVSYIDHVIRIYYKKDLSAEYSYEIEYYQDGELFKTVPGTVPVFDGNVITECESFCPAHYLTDFDSSTPLPYTVSEENHLIQIYYKKNLDAQYAYMVEYYQDGELFKTFSGTVPVFGDHVITTYEDFCPEYYLLDDSSSTPLPYTVSEETNIIQVYYKKDQSAKYSYTIEYYKDGELFKSIPGTVPVFTPTISSALSFCPSGYTQDTSSSTALPYNISKDGDAVKIYYVSRDTVFPYRVEYYKEGLWMKTISGNISASSPVVSAVPSYCPQYYVVDSISSTALPHTVSPSDQAIKIYYKKDENAMFPYTVEYYKDGELLDSTSGNVSVFNPRVNEYDNSFCPEGYVLDTTASSTFPYTISGEDHVIKVCYVDSGEVIPYTVEHYRGDYLMKTESLNVPVSNPVVNVIWPVCPDGYLIDESSSTPLPHTITQDDNLLKIYYRPDMSNPMTAFINMVADTMRASSDLIIKVIALLLVPVLLIIMIKGSTNFFKYFILAPAGLKRPKTYNGPYSARMKGVHNNTGANIADKARMTQGNHPGRLKSKANLASRTRSTTRRR